ncbi:4-amino-4-deoxy-L-arabinose-phosphoundecaprenol flippase subunit ArnE [compost metagenome]|uniref:SMR family transporter n=1 Tax=Janthinobacterium sp. AD80 TaxID=1528773 RepID=UPI000C859D4E|nr:SMR family transporter [Janthinobacterium sp. AD80]PMQ15188.1 4-amino-4-deoxy-L-arabinose-phosphoundecaprenol flippase subunit ArnE [Janthinobacterium sp. AD80]
MNSVHAGYLWCALAAVASAAATFLIKMSSQYGSGLSLVRLLWLGGAGGAYALGFVCYAVALEKLQMSLAYPVMTAITMLLVALLGCLALQEGLSLSKIAGIVLITAGAFVLSRPA